MVSRRQIVGFIMPLLLIVSIFASVRPAAAQPCGGDAEPARTSFNVVDNGDGSDTATFKFRLTQAEIDALQCNDMPLEIGFRFTGYETHEGETSFDLDSDTLRLLDEHQEYADNDVITQWVSIDVDELVAGVYDLSADFEGFYAIGIDEREHLLSVLWAAPSEWYPEEYLGQCDDDLVDTVIVDDEAYCTYGGEPVELGVHDFGY